MTTNQAVVVLTEADHEEIRTAKPLKVPPKTGILRGARFYFRAKIGGYMQLTTVMCKGEPYKREMGAGRSAWYVDVFGYGVSQPVNIKKLRQIPEVKRG